METDEEEERVRRAVDDDVGPGIGAKADTPCPNRATSRRRTNLVGVAISRIV